MRQPIQPTLLLMANRKPVYTYFDIGSQFRQWWYKSESILRYLLFKFSGIKPVGLPIKFHGRFSKIRAHKASSQRSYDRLRANAGQLRVANQVRNLPKRWPNIDRLLGCSTNAPLYLKKWRRTFRSDLTSFALISLAVQRSSSEEEVQWQKLSSLLKRLVNETHKVRESNLPINDELFKLDNFLFGSYIGKGCNAAIYDAQLKEPFASESVIFKDKKLAIKMLFNYDTESNAHAIYSAMNKETVPFDGSFGPEIDQLTGRLGRTKLPAHPNIVKLYGIFVDQIPELPRAKELFKNALPPRLHEQGYGRNMTLFLVMKKYHINLKDYLKYNRPSPDQSLSLLTQLFNGVEHLVNNCITHRDLKSDNILLEFDLDQHYPTLVITDFGLCVTQLSIPYLSDDVCIGGNRALTAPEIITAVPGLFSRLNYSKSDLWATGALSYEIFNHCNPFYPDASKNGAYLNSYNYKEAELPTPFHMPTSLQKLVRQILNRDPSRRPEVEICSTMCALLMFCNELSLKCIANSRLEEKELMRRIDLLLSDTLFFARKKLNKLQLKVKLMFLMNLEIQNVKEALKYFEI